MPFPSLVLVLSCQSVAPPLQQPAAGSPTSSAPPPSTPKRLPLVGQACSQETEAVCQSRQMLICASGVWEAVDCLGPGGCNSCNHRIQCDETIARADAPCGTGLAEHFSCTSDGRFQLKCKNGLWKHAASCRGPKGCQTVNTVVHCDNSISRLGDLCHDTGNFSCAHDGLAVLRCEDGRFVHEGTCTSQKCVIEGTVIQCR